MAEPGDPNYRYSVNEYPTNGVQTEFELSFAGGYISKDYVRVRFTDAAGSVTYPAFEFIGDYQISITPALGSGGTVMIYRNTPAGDPVVDFSDGSVINETALDILARQAVNLAAETRDIVGSIPSLDVLQTTLATLAFVTNRNNQTGTQAISTVAGLQSALNGKASTALATQGFPGLMPIVDKIKADRTVDLRALGARGNGSSNDRSYFLDAISAAGEYIAPIRVTGGNYRIEAPIEDIPSGVLFEGSGKETCYLTAPYGDADILVFGTGQTSSFYSGLRNLTVRCAHPAPTAGAGIVFDGAAGVICENVRSRGHWIAYHWRNNAGTCRLYNSQVEDTVHIGHYIQDATDPWIEGSYSFGVRDGTSVRTDIGLRIEQMNGGRIMHSSWGLFDTGIAVVPGPGQWCLNTFFDCVEADLNGYAGLNIAPTGDGYAARIKFIAGRFGFTSNGYGVVLDSPRTDGIEFIGGEAERCIKGGVLINGAKGVVFTGFVAIGNNWFNDGNNSNSFNGFEILSGDDIVINGGRAGRYSSIGHTSAVPASQNFGIAIQNSFTGRLTIRDVDCTGNKLGPIINLSNSNNVTIEEVLGYLPIGPIDVTLTASPFGYVAGASREILYISGGVVTSIIVGGKTVAQGTNVSNTHIPLMARQGCVITYSSAPTLSKVIY